MGKQKDIYLSKMKEASVESKTQKYFLQSVDYGNFKIRNDQLWRKFLPVRYRHVLDKFANYT